MEHERTNTQGVSIVDKPPVAGIHSPKNPFADRCENHRCDYSFDACRPLAHGCPAERSAAAAPPPCHDMQTARTRGVHCLRGLAHADSRFHIQSDYVFNVPPQRNKVDSKISALHPLLDHIKTSPNLI